MAVKGNPGKLCDAIKRTFEQAESVGFEAVTYDQHTEIDKGHDRITESRQCTVLPLMCLHRFKPTWKGLQSIVMIESERHIGDKRQREQRFYVRSLPHLIKKEPSKMSVPRKRRMVSLYDDFRHKCLQLLKF